MQSAVQTGKNKTARRQQQQGQLVETGLDVFSRAGMGVVYQTLLLLAPACQLQVYFPSVRLVPNAICVES
jgi:hypothetical protein